MKSFSFKLNITDGCARSGLITTAHGAIETPVFMPVGTAGSVKGVVPEELLNLNAQIILGNTYHLYLAPGTDILERFGGLHKFMNWHKPILTDSGGYQVFSLSQDREGKSLVKINEQGVIFSSYKDGSKHLFTPEKVIEIQSIIGSDIMMPLDWCPSAEADEKEIEKAVNMTSQWFERAYKDYTNRKFPYGYKPALFAIVQGGTIQNLRERSFNELSKFDVDGFAIGGVANAGESKEKQAAALDATLPLLPEDKPRYLMGVGEPEDLLTGISKGIDMFDCVSPTRLGRHGVAYTNKGKINLRNSCFKTDDRPLSEDCHCYACEHFSRGYLAHLIRENEIVGLRMVSLHNVAFLVNLIDRAREAIKLGEYEKFMSEFLETYQ